ncbi:hypothetical protein VPHK469_0121 [Vibrio phage K469]
MNWKTYLLAAVLCLGTYTGSQFQQMAKAAASPSTWEMVDKGKDCGRSCFNWGIYRNVATGEQSVVNIGTYGYSQRRVGEYRIFKLDYVPFFGIAGMAYTPIRHNSFIGLTCLLIGMCGIALLCCSLVSYYTVRESKADASL